MIKGGKTETLRSSESIQIFHAYRFTLARIQTPTQGANDKAVYSPLTRAAYRTEKYKDGEISLGKGEQGVLDIGSGQKSTIHTRCGVGADMSAILSIPLLQLSLSEQDSSVRSARRGAQ